MTTIIDTVRGLSEWIETEFEDPPLTKDITEGFDRPCTYIQPVDLSTSREGDLRLDEISFDIIRFAEKSDRGYLELLQYQEKFAELLMQPIPISDSFFLYPEDVEFELRRDDMLLIVSFTVENIQPIEDKDNSPLMNELDLNTEKDGD